MATFKNTNICEDAQKQKLINTIGGNVSFYINYAKQCEDSLKKNKNRTTTQSSGTTPGHIPKRM
jgi:hypothetical protein